MENRIGESRRARHWTQKDLAERVGVTRQTIISLEKGHYNASLLLAHKLAVCFDTAIEDLFLFEEETAPDTIFRQTIDSSREETALQKAVTEYKTVSSGAR